MADDFDYLWKIYFAVKDWIKFSDAKAAAIIAFYSIILTIFFPKLLMCIPIILINPVLEILVIIFLTTSVASISLCISSIWPVLKEKTSHSVIYFADISFNYKNPNAYSFDVIKVLQNEMIAKKQISEQIWALSKIATQKYKRISLSIICLVASILTGIAVFFGVLIQTIIIC